MCGELCWTSRRQTEWTFATKMSHKFGFLEFSLCRRTAMFGRCSRDVLAMRRCGWSWMLLVVLTDFWTKGSCHTESACSFAQSTRAVVGWLTLRAQHVIDVLGFWQVTWRLFELAVRWSHDEICGAGVFSLTIETCAE